MDKCLARQSLDDINNQPDILLLAQNFNFTLCIQLAERCVFQDMKQVKLDTINLQVCKDVRGCQHIFTILAGEPEDYMHADVQAT